jgi:hypothetical protein
MDGIVLYFVYLLGAAGSSYWVYRDARKRDVEYARSIALATAVFFPVGLLFYVLSR